MSILEKIKSRTNIDVEYMITRLKKLLGNENEENIQNAVYEIMLVILDTINQSKIQVYYIQPGYK